MPALVGALVGAVAAALVAVVVTGAVEDDPEAAAPEDPPGDVQGILDQVQETVVTIETSGYGRGSAFEGAGTGVVLSADGLVLTNAHVVADSDGISVRMFDGARHDADVVGSSSEHDLAVIRLDGASGLDAATLGSSDDLVVGEPVVAIGNALNLGGRPSVTTGIVSATNRSIPTPDGGELTGLVQTDAAINVGNSGGPLVDAGGEVVGINTAILADTQSIGFSIGIDGARPVIEDLRRGGGDRAGGEQRPLLGVSTVGLGAVDEAVRDRLGIEADEGAFVTTVGRGTGAEDAGLEPGDVIVGVDGAPVTSPQDLSDAVSQRDPGDEVELRVERGGREETVTAEIGSEGD